MERPQDGKEQKMSGIFTDDFILAMKIMNKGVKPDNFDGEIWYFSADGDIAALFKNYLAENEAGEAVG